MPIQFGTDGWRAVISEDFTFDNVRHVAQAIAEETAAQTTENRSSGRPLMVVGFDTRFLSDRYAIAVSEVLAANEIEVLLAQADAPTPMVSYAIVHNAADGGVMITASHNPPRYNGIKLKSAQGGSASSEKVKGVEARVNDNLARGVTPNCVEYTDALSAGLIRRFDPLPAYDKHIRKIVNFDTIRSGSLRVAVDPMYGAGRVYLRELLAEAGCNVTELRNEMNPGFNGIHPEPIARHLGPLIDEVQRDTYDIGVATDGDADRIGAVDPTGEFVDPHCIMALLVEYLVRDRGMSGSIVKTVSTTQMLNRLALRYGIPIHETPVGFNHISDLMLQEQVLLGGEESGGITVLGHIPEGDGVLMALLLVEMVAARKQTLVQQLETLMESPDIGRFRYARLDQPVRPFSKADLVDRLASSAPAAIGEVLVVEVNCRDGIKYLLEDDSWLLVRPSGTEPVLRIYAEARSDEQVQELLRIGAEMAQAQIGASLEVVPIQ
jgi:alpha-D-glucose phosphate-specific phosphoglucomutase